MSGPARRYQRPAGPDRSEGSALAMAEPNYITLEEAFERSSYLLEPLYKATAKWRANEKHYRLLEPRLVNAPPAALEPMRFVRLDFENELGAANAHFRQLLATRKLAIEIRLWGRLDAPWTPLRPDNAPWLSILVVDPAAKSLSLHRPDGKRLDCRLSAPAPGASAPEAPKKTAVEHPKRPAGRPPKVYPRVCNAMRATPPDILRVMTHEGMKVEFKACAEICKNARKEVLSESEIVSGQNQLEK
jgi:hypothetical protein